MLHASGLPETQGTGGTAAAPPATRREWSGFGDPGSPGGWKTRAVFMLDVI